MPTRVFISYRHEDMDDATDRLKLALKGHFGEDNVFTDIDNLELGDDFGERIAEYIESCDVLLAVIGRGWVDARDDEDQRRLEDPDDWVRIEIETALERNIRVVPVLLYGTKVPKKQELPDSLWPMLRKTGIEVPREWFDPAVEKLIKAIEKPAARPTRQAAPPANEPAPPPKAESPTIFINYRRDDTAAAARLLYDRLSARFGNDEIFFDIASLRPGVSWLDEVGGTASRAIVLSLIGPRWLRSLKDRANTAEAIEDRVRLEIEYALQRGSGIILIPVLVDDASLPTATELPRSLQGLTEIQAAQVRITSFDADIERLADRIEALTREAPSHAVATPRTPTAVADTAPER